MLLKAAAILVVAAIEQRMYAMVKTDQKLNLHMDSANQVVQ
jgi:hypothetical protein